MSRVATIKAACEKSIVQHGSIRKAAKALGIDHAYLFRLKTGEKTGPSEELIEKLGLYRVITTKYYWS